MGRTYISDRLMPQQTLLQYMDFHELMELLTFNRYTFSHPGATQHEALLRKACRLRKQGPMSMHSTPGVSARPGTTRLRVRGRIAMQWWGPVDSVTVRASRPSSLHRPRIGILSTVQALGNALCLGEHDLYITETHATRS